MGFTIRLDIIFTKLLRHFTECWKKRGIKTIVYIDDGIASFRGFEITKSISELTRNDLVFTAFVINNEKSDFNPKAKGKWPGTVINTFTVPQEKITKLLVNITKYLNQQFLIPKRFLKVQRY